MEDQIEKDPCMICRTWPKSKKFSDNDLFDYIKVSPEDSALMHWLTVFKNVDKIDRKSFKICEVHFMKDDLTRETDSNGLPLLKLTNTSVTPAFVTFDECLFNNQIENYTDFLLEYHKCLNTQKWNMEATEDEVTFMLKSFEVVIRVKSSLFVVVQESSNTFEQGSILQSHLNNGVIEYWSKLRGLMLFCEENSPFTEVMIRLGATVVLEGGLDDMFTSLDDVLCYVKTILDNNWFYEVFSDENYIVGFQLEPRKTPIITKAIKIYTDFSMTGYVNGEIIGTKSPGTLRFLKKMNKEEVEKCLESDENDEPNWDTNKIDLLNNDQIHSFDFLVENINQYVTSEWQLTLHDQHLILYKSDMKAIPRIKCAIKFNKKLKCFVYANGAEIDINSIIPTFEENSLTFSTLETIIQVVNDIERTTFSENETIEEGELPPLIKQEFIITEPRTVSDKRPLETTKCEENINENDFQENDLKKPCIEINLDDDDPLNHEVTTTDDSFPVINQSEPQTGFTCLECGESKSTHNALVRHMLKHKKEFSCQLCSKKLKTPTELRNHMDSDHSLTHNGFSCSKCQKYFLSQDELESHECVEYPNQIVTENKKIVCQLCHTIFKRKQSLSTHMKTIHCLEKEYVEAITVNYKSIFTCKICGESSDTYRKLLNHIKTHFEQENEEILGFEETHNADQLIFSPDDTEEEGEIILGGNSDVFIPKTEQSLDKEISSEVDEFQLVYGKEYQEDLNCDEEDSKNEIIIKEEFNE